MSLLVVEWVFTWTRAVLQVVGPTNRLDAYLHARRGMKRGLATCLPLAAACVLGARLIESSSTVCVFGASLIAMSGPTGDYAVWQMLLWALLWFDAMKLVRMGIVSVALLICTRIADPAPGAVGAGEVGGAAGVERAGGSSIALEVTRLRVRVTSVIHWTTR